MNTSENLKQRIVGQSMTDRVYDAILAMILRLEIKPREKLSEVQLSKELGVSRTPVREAFLRLESLGFLDIVPQRGTIVAPMRDAEFRKSQFMREAFELALVRRAIELEDNSELCMALDRELKLQTVHSELADENSFFESDEAFHEAIAVHCGVAEIWPEVQRVKMHMDRFRYAIRSQRETSTILEQHRRIAEAICNRNEAEALAAMTLHLRRANHLIADAAKEHPEYFEL
ncbi:MAG: GntR family transcriptional regulator [Roseibium album]|nr:MULTISPECIES: GntR family transcriptional regulator [Stappiaceae]MBG6155818.1 DNA-binding GntR family transcriptional regulator [Labrenzia sp. EL_162]MBG6161273.1 DNA-binding GntR family transcriptional regulator [Labrenzia sp. EL_195]MBG6177200.1 DNA-binding GntR family transcriptional regulator [Labrenzia sp. EL_132]MBG6194352.1 DNA-binding GntR family transcriptional regulator [Labrenzia sp. EL_159]MBG6200715.1 DNA-binding GntR family transcriptional regulator [Labrenzia sp. EL_13]MBG62